MTTEELLEAAEKSNMHLKDIYQEVVKDHGVMLKVGRETGQLKIGNRKDWKIKGWIGIAIVILMIESGEEIGVEKDVMKEGEIMKVMKVESVKGAGVRIAREVRRIVPVVRHLSKEIPTKVVSSKKIVKESS
jgi:hypothetical protein